MKQIEFGRSGQKVSAVAMGCMRLGWMEQADVERAVGTALESGVTFFDHADIYGGGSCEEKFGAAMKALGVDRDSIFIQSKCGIRKGMYDWSKEYILESVDGILKRLGTDHLDALLLHRPDALMEPEEVAEAFDTLQAAGKVKHFGLSNVNTLQMELVQRAVSQPLCANQLQFSLIHNHMIRSGFEVNMDTEGAQSRDGMMVEYCRLHGITLQTWSPFCSVAFAKPFIDNPDYPALNAKLNELAEKYGVTPSAVAAAWILRHPAGMQVISGSTNPARIAGIAKAGEITLTRPEWYAVYTAAGNILP